MKKALSIRQPWAWLVVNGHKPVENRTWSCKHRGPLTIHAAKKFDRHGYQWVKENFPEIHMPEEKEFNCGGFVGEVDMVDCVNSHNSPWFFGEWGFVFETPKVIPFKIHKGRLGVFGYE